MKCIVKEIITSGDACHKCICGVVKKLAGKDVCGDSNTPLTGHLRAKRGDLNATEQQLQIEWITKNTIKDFNNDYEKFGECCVNTSK